MGIQCTMWHMPITGVLNNQDGRSGPSMVMTGERYSNLRKKIVMSGRCICMTKRAMCIFSWTCIAKKFAMAWVALLWLINTILLNFDNYFQADCRKPGAAHRPPH